MNIGASQARPADLSDLPGILSQKDQRKAFGKAKRHTIIVKLLKFLLPMASLGIVSLYFIPRDIGRVVTGLPVQIDAIDLSSKGLKMINPRYSGGNDKLGRYKVEADYALQQVTATHIMELHNISGEIEQPNKKWTKLQATKGIYNTRTERMDLQGSIVVSSNQGMEARLQSARIDMKDQVIITDQPVHMKMNDNIIDAGRMILNVAQKRVLFTGGVKVKLLKNKSMTK